MSLFRKSKLKRLQPDRSKTGSVRTFASLIKIRPLTNILLAILVAVLIQGFLTINQNIEISSLLAFTLVTFGVVFIMGFYLISLEAYLFSSFIRLLSFCLLSVSVFALIAIFQALNWPLYFLPITLITMIIAVGYSRQLAIVNIFFQLFLLGIWESPSFHIVMMHCPAALIAALGLMNIRTRAKIIRLAAICGITLFIMVCIKSIFETLPIDNFGQSHFLKDIAKIAVSRNALISFANGLVSGFVLLGILPFLEKWFAVITNLSLLELADLNQPLLKRLSLEAPGTYHHSLRVGDLAEAAADAIGADTMLTRVGAYYHDIGKLNKPEYFVENEAGGESKHKDLSPTMSTLVIIAHVKDGLELARLHKLPKRIQGFVIQHHGTSVMKYFYREALDKTNNHHDDEVKNGKESEQSSNNAIKEETFSYPGPKPQSKEVGIVMLADGVEAVSRTLTNITPGKLKSVVHEIVTNHLMAGQLDHSDLTMNELRKIEETFIRVLAGMLHARIQYPQTPVETKEKTT